MEDSSGRPGVPRPSEPDQSILPAHPPTEVATPRLPTEVASQNRPTEVLPHAETEIAASHPPTEMAVPYPETEAAGRGSGPRAPVSAPPAQTGSAAEQVWRTGRLPEAPRRRRRVRRVASAALTVILLAAAGVGLYLRFHHAPLQVKAVAITQRVTNGCAVDVTGRIATNGSAGTVSYQWLFKPQAQAPQPMSQSVVAGQDAVYVTVALDGQGRGSAAQTVTLQVLGPGTGTAVAHVVVSC